MLSNDDETILKINSIISRLYQIREVYKPFYDHGDIFVQTTKLIKLMEEINKEDWNLKRLIHSFFYSYPYCSKKQIEIIDKLINYFVDLKDKFNCQV